jgi:HK97 gp10 family phage protein
MSMADIFKNIEALKSKAEAETARAVRATAQAIRNDAIISVKSHLSAGNVYTRGTVKHVASKPGSPPNQDRGTLTRNIRVTMNDDLTADISSNAPYSAALEFGTRKMAARPFMTPAVEGQRVKHKERLQKAIMRAESYAK